MSKILTLDFKDLGKGLVTAVLAAIFTMLAQAMNVPGFDFTTFDWSQVIKMAIMTGFAYLGKNLLSDSQGKVLGKIG